MPVIITHRRIATLLPGCRKMVWRPLTTTPCPQHHQHLLSVPGTGHDTCDALTTHFHHGIFCYLIPSGRFALPRLNGLDSGYGRVATCLHKTSSLFCQNCTFCTCCLVISSLRILFTFISMIIWWRRSILKPPGHDGRSQ